jgi:methylphosphotriester-DNA--protein-cysteine methyltransferase
MTRYKILKNNKILLSAIEGAYSNHRGYKIFGVPYCSSAKALKKDERIYFENLEDAISQGYSPCKNCRPLNEKDFKRLAHMIKYFTLEEFYNSGTKF